MEMNEVSLNGPGFLDACTQRNKEAIGVTGHDDSHIRVVSIFAFSRLPMARTTSFSLLPTCPDGTGVFPAMTGIDHNGDHTFQLHFSRVFQRFS